jgi:hypothetical protein
VVVEDVQAIVAPALDAHARAAQLGKPIDVEGLETETGLDLPPHPVGPRLGAEKAGTELERVAGFLLGDRFRKYERVRRGRAQDRAPEVVHQHHLALSNA